jgi:hypothetical protein
VNKSEAIREYLKEKPDAKPREVVAGLLEKGIEVSAGLVAQQKYKKAPEAASAGGSRGNRDKAGWFSVDDVVRVQKLSSELGGIAKLRSIVELLEKMSVPF